MLFRKVLLSITLTCNYYLYGTPLVNGLNLKI